VRSGGEDWDVAAGSSLWLQRGEHLLWRSGPDPSVTFSKQDRVLVPFSLLWGGLAITWGLSSSSHGFNVGDLFGIPFVAMGNYIVAGRFMYKRWDRGRTRYAVTNRRAVVVRSHGRQVIDSSVTAPTTVERRRDGRHGSVIWALPGAVVRGDEEMTRGSGWPGASQARSGEFGFFDVDDVEGLLTVVNRCRLPD
jgi:hypothetical protein